MKIRIYYHDTDCGGVVYYANYLKYLEEARTEFLEERGIYINDLYSKGTLFVVARQEIDYKSPAFYGDVLQIKTWVNEVSRLKINFENEIRNQKGELVAVAKTVLVHIDKTIKPRPMTEELKEKILSKEVK